MPGEPDTDDLGGAARVERWFLRVMLGVSVVAWLSLVLAELGQFRMALLGLLLTLGAFGLSLLATPSARVRLNLSPAAG